MTRINLIPVSELTDQHLLAEHRELKRIPNLIKSWKYNLENIPDQFVLWTWHVKFFYNKLLFLKLRYIELHQECLKRWFNVMNYIESFQGLPSELMNNYEATQEAIKLSQSRIDEKIIMKPLFYKYNWKVLSKNLIPNY